MFVVRTIYVFLPASPLNSLIPLPLTSNGCGTQIFLPPSVQSNVALTSVVYWAVSEDRHSFVIRYTLLEKYSSVGTQSPVCLSFILYVIITVFRTKHYILMF